MSKFITTNWTKIRYFFYIFYIFNMHKCQMMITIIKHKEKKKEFNKKKNGSIKREFRSR